MKVTQLPKVPWWYDACEIHHLYVGRRVIPHFGHKRPASILSGHASQCIMYNRSYRGQIATQDDCTFELYVLSLCVDVVVKIYLRIRRLRDRRFLDGSTIIVYLLFKYLGCHLDFGDPNFEQWTLNFPSEGRGVLALENIVKRLPIE
jgi:hypothetical protein